MRKLLKAWLLGRDTRSKDKRAGSLRPPAPTPVSGKPDSEDALNKVWGTRSGKEL